MSNIVLRDASASKNVVRVAMAFLTETEKRADVDVTCAISNLRAPREHGNVVLVFYFCQEF